LVPSSAIVSIFVFPGGRERGRDVPVGRESHAYCEQTLRRVVGRQKPSAAGVLRSQQRLPFFSRLARTRGRTRRTHHSTLDPSEWVVCLNKTENITLIISLQCCRFVWREGVQSRNNEIRKTIKYVLLYFIIIYIIVISSARICFRRYVFFVSQLLIIAFVSITSMNHLVMMWMVVCLFCILLHNILDKMHIIAYSDYKT